MGFKEQTMPNHFIEERQDVIFRRVRGILNKITPETFDKLSNELVNVGLDSPRTLRGVIYLLFDKALKDLKYSSLYAKLCQELSEKAPNFEQEPGPNTFCKFLISKCEDEFERRRKATEDFDSKNELTDEEFELKAIAKQKMLGNIKFICELGKKRLLQEEILHECIRGLLAKKRERPTQDQAQDLECLCQIMRTIGSLLDIKASKNLMNQYFERIDMFSKKQELPSRIRFMLRDVIDLRNNNWRPRPFQREDNVPQPLSKLREEAGFESSSSPNSSSIDKLGNNKDPLGLNKLHGDKFSMLLDDEPSFTTTTDFHWGPSFLPHDQSFDLFNTTRPTTQPIKSVTTITSNTRIQPNNIISTSTPPLSGNLGVPPFQNKETLSTHYSKRTNVRPMDMGNKTGDGADMRGFMNHDMNPFGSTQRNLPYHQHQPHLSSVQHDNVMNGPPVNMRNHRESSFKFRNNGIANNYNSANRTMQPLIKRDENQQPGFGNSGGGGGGGGGSNLGSRRFNDFKVPNMNPSFHVPSQEPRGNGNISPIRSNPVIRRSEQYQPLESNNSMQMAPSNTSFNVQQHVQSNRFNNKNVPAENLDNRRFHRADSLLDRDQHSHNQIAPHRQPKFSGANYRPARPLSTEHYHSEKSHSVHQSESELNPNWRVGPPSKPIKPSATVTNANQPADGDAPITHPNTKLTGHLTNERVSSTESRMKSDNVLINPEQKSQNQSVDMFQVKFDNGRVIEKKTFVEKNLGVVKQDYDTGNSPLPFTQTSSTRIIDSRVNIDVKDASNPLADLNIVKPRPPDIRPPAVHPASYSNYRNHNMRNHQHVDNYDRKEPRKFGRSFDSDRHPPQRFVDNSESRNPRNAAGFKGQNENTNLHSESNRNPNTNWRKENNQENSPVKQPNTMAPLVAANPILAKPPTRVIDPNFSLRPSHNLAGRSSIKQTNNSETSNAGTDGSNEKGTIRSDIVPTVPQLPAMPSLKVETEPTNDSKESSAPNNAEKNAAKDFHVNKFISVLSEYLNESSSNVGRTVSKVKELKIPKSYQDECLISAMKQSILKTENDRDNICKLFVHLIPATFESSSLLSAFKIIFEQMHALEVETPKIKSLVAGILGQTVYDGLLSLEDVGNVLVGGKHHPLFLLFLQKLQKRAGQAWLSEKFIASKINLIDMLPEIDRSKERLATALKDRCLGFLDPMLTIEPDMWVQMKQKDPSPAAIYRWIKDNVDAAIQTTPPFAHVLASCLLRYIHQTALEKSRESMTEQKDLSDTDGSQQSSKSSPSSSSQNTNDLERELLSKYQQVLQAILKDRHMQLATLYALQSHFYKLDFPKGSLLRWFHMLYDLNVVDDEVFFIWKEEINDEFPGKGQALFQVNTWLNWLAEAESEEEEEEEDEEDDENGIENIEL